MASRPRTMRSSEIVQHLTWRGSFAKDFRRKMKGLISRSMRRVIRKAGYDVVLHDPFRGDYPSDFSSEHISILNKVRGRTMTSPERIYALTEAVKYITRQNIPGSIVECGVWRGGSMMAVALTLRNLGCTDRDLYLFDTFAGMPKPQNVDVDFNGYSAMPLFTSAQTGEDTSDFCLATLPEVQAGMADTHYDQQLTHFVKGKVEETHPHKPRTKSLCCALTPTGTNPLDTDW